jgi:hypothetical protein
MHEAVAPHASVVGCCAHAPLPLHAPVLPQGPVLRQRPCGSVTAPTNEHVPAGLRLQAWQVGQLPALQQTPSVQEPLAHWLAAVQTTPSAFLGTQLVPEQKFPLEQSPSPAQVVLQALVPQA